jgi:hypothetical protein
MFTDILNSSTTHLLLLLAMSALVRWLWLQPSAPPTASGATVMAGGIFALGALQKIPGPVDVYTRLLCLELLLIWLYIGAGLIASMRRGTFHVHVDDPVGSFAIGTWVAATSTLGTLVKLAFPDWSILLALMGVVMVAVWVWYVWQIVPGFRLLFTQGAKLQITGRILLSTVATQSLVVFWAAVYPDTVNEWLARGVIGLGLVFYVLGFVLLVRRYVGRQDWSLATDWDNTNCIIHGAMSITGNAALRSGVLPPEMVLAIWLWTAVMFVLVELIEIARMVARVAKYGWGQGVFSYNVSQWARNFTFGMFYIFTLLYRSRLGDVPDVNMPWLVAIQDGILAWGQYVVLFFLAAEVAIFLLRSAGLRLQARAADEGRRVAMPNA